MQNFGGLCCNICLNYLLKPVTAICGHSFCEYCIDQYFLILDFCPVCEKSIRNGQFNNSTTLCEFVENFVENNHKEEWPEYKKRLQDLKNWKEEKRLGTIKVGMNIDIRDKNYVWCEGRVIRIISRVGQAHKFVKVQYLDYEEKVEEDLKVISDRLAKHNFYTKRGDIPKYKEGVKNQIGTKMKEMNKLIEKE